MWTVIGHQNWLYPEESTAKLLSCKIIHASFFCAIFVLFWHEMTKYSHLQSSAWRRRDGVCSTRPIPTAFGWIKAIKEKFPKRDGHLHLRYTGSFCVCRSIRWWTPRQFWSLPCDVTSKHISLSQHQCWLSSWFPRWGICYSYISTARFPRHLYLTVRPLQSRPWHITGWRRPIRWVSLISLFSFYHSDRSVSRAPSIDTWQVERVLVPILKLSRWPIL